MRRQVVLVVAVLAILLGAAVFWPRSSAPDLVYARDRFLDADALVATFQPQGTGGYRFTLIRDSGWVWERTEADGSPQTDLIVFNGREHLLQLAPGCFVPVADFRDPLIPGISVASRLARTGGLEREEGGKVSYDVAAAPWGPLDMPQSLPPVHITEDLSSLVSQQAVLASTGSDPDLVWRGPYRISHASPDDVAHAAGLISSAKASDWVQLRVRERFVGTAIGGLIIGPLTAVIAQDCPDRVYHLGPVAGGGQIEGLRASPAAFIVTTGAAPVIKNGTTVGFSMFQSHENLEFAFQNATFTDIPITTAEVIIVNRGRPGGLAVQVLSCTARPWFAC